MIHHRNRNIAIMQLAIEELEYEINSYDDNLYEILEDYVTDTVGSYTALQEFIHDRREQW